MTVTEAAKSDPLSTLIRNRQKPLTLNEQVPSPTPKKQAIPLTPNRPNPATPLSSLSLSLSPILRREFHHLLTTPETSYIPGPLSPII